MSTCRFFLRSGVTLLPSLLNTSLDARAVDFPGGLVVAIDGTFNDNFLPCRFSFDLRRTFKSEDTTISSKA